MISKCSNSLITKYSHFGSSGGSKFSNVFGFTFGAMLEEQIGKKIFRCSRMRMVLHHAIDCRKLNLRKYIYMTTIFILFCALFVFISFYII